MTKGVARPRYLDLLAPSSCRAAAPSSFARRKRSPALIVITLTIATSNQESPPPRLEREVQTVLFLAVSGSRLLDQNLAAYAILDPGSQPSYDTVVSTDDVPLFTLVHVDSTPVKGAPADGAILGDQGTKKRGILGATRPPSLLTTATRKRGSSIR